MSCDKMDALLLQDYLEETIDPLEKIFVESHLSICKECRRELTELKLMFWDLNNKSNYELEYPEELDNLRTNLIDNFLGEDTRISVKKVVNMQVDTIKMSSKFLEYMPGAKQTPKVLKKASKGLAKGFAKGVKRMLEAK
jgi:hypothetical protein